MNSKERAGQIEAQNKRLDEKQAVIDQQQNKAIFHGVWRSCLGCINFNKRDESCMMFKARPPAHIIVNGCRDYDQDIPF